ncbi:hypothetical protein ACTA71_001810 [Dictyostelium dimigraforme]
MELHCNNKIIFLIFILLNYTDIINSLNLIDFKIIGIVDGYLDNTNNFGLNYMFEQDLIKISVDLGIPNKNIKFYNFNNISNIDNNNDILYKIINEEKIDLIIFYKSNFLENAINISNTFKNLTIIIINDNIISNTNNSNNNNIFEIKYPFKISTLLSGYVSGLISETNIIGYLKTNKIEDQSLLDIFYFGAKLSNPMVKLMFYTIDYGFNNASNNNFQFQEIMELSISSLLKNNVDLISSSFENDGYLTFCNVLLKKNIKIIGSNGFMVSPPFNKDDVLFNSVYNLTSNILPIISNLIYNNNSNNSTNNNNSNNSTNNNNSNNSTNNNHSMYQYNIGLIFNPLISNIIINNVYSNLPIIENKILNDTNIILTNQLNNESIIDLGIISGNIVFKPISKSIEYGITIISCILIGGLIVIQICIIKYKNKPSFKSASPTFLIFIVIGGIVVYIGVIIWVSGVNVFTCNAKFWLISLGFTMMIGGIVVKNFRIWLIFDNPKLYHIKITNLQLLPWVLGMFLLNVFLLSLITGLGKLTPFKVFNDSNFTSYEIQCEMMDSGLVALYFLLGYFAIIVIIGIFVSWKIRIVDIKEFNESKSVAYSLYSIVFCILIIAPLMISKTGHNTEILCSGCIFIVTAIIVIMFIPKFWGLKVYGAEGSNEIFRQSSTASSSKRKNNDPNNLDSISKKSSKNAPKRVNLFLYDFTDDDEESKHSSSKDIDVFTTIESIQPNSEAANEMTNYDDPTFTEPSEQPTFTELSEQPNPTPRTLTATPRTNDLTTPRTTDLITPRTTDLITPRTNDLGTPRTNDLNTPRTDGILTPRSNNSLFTPRIEDPMSPRQYHNMMITLSPILEEENNEKNVKKDEIIQHFDSDSDCDSNSVDSIIDKSEE